MDQYSRAWMESSSGRSALADARQAEEYQRIRREEYQRFWQIADEKARQLDFIPEKLSKEVFLSHLSYRYFSFSPDLFPNYEEIFPDFNSRKIELTFYDTLDDRRTKNPYTKHTESEDLMNAVFKRRVSHYFYEDIKDFGKEGLLDLFIDYLDFSNDIDLDKIAENPALSDEHIKNIVEKLHSEDRDFLQINLFMAHPHAFSPEQAEKIIINKWFYADLVPGGRYDLGDYYPSHTGMAQPDVEFRQKLDTLSKEILGTSIYDLNIHGKKYFDKLWDMKQYDELLACHYDEFLEKIKSSGSYAFLVQDLSFDKEGMLTEEGWNKQFLPIIDSMITPEDEEKLSSSISRYGRGATVYLQNRALQGKLFSRNIMKNIVDRDADCADFLFAHKDELNKDILKALYEDAWLYARSSKSMQELKKEYQELVGEDIENVKETWAKKYPIGSSRFDILCRNRNIERIASEYPDKFLNLSEEDVNEMINRIYIRWEGDYNIEPEYQDIFNLMNKYIDKFGSEAVTKILPKNVCSDLLAVRYMQGVREIKEIEFLRKNLSDSFILEREFNKSGDTLKGISYVPNLLKEQNFELVDLIIKRGYHFKDDEEKYKCLRDFIELSLYDAEKNPKVQQYVDDFIKNANIDWRDIEVNFYSSEQDTLDFMLEKYGKISTISKKDLEYMLNKARRSENVSNKAMKKLHELGYDFKPHMAFNLIRYSGKYREVNIDLENRDLSQYDFEAKFFLDRPYHPSSHSHTTFLNETLQYWEREATVAALNNGASPFNKAGFFMDKFEAMPFNMMFSKALKENKTAELKNFMGYIAANLDESKKGVLKDIWTSLGQKLRSDTRVQTLIRDTDNILESRDFEQERIDKELKLKAEEERRKQEEEKARIELEERRLAEEKRQRENAVATLKQNILDSLSDIISMDNKTIAENIAHYLENNKSELPVVPNADELAAIKIAAIEKKTEELKIKQKRDEEKQIQMIEDIQKAIEEKESESASFLSPQEVGEFVTKYFEKDVEAKPFVDVTIKKFSEEAKEKAEIQKKLDKVNKVAADKLLDFYEADEIHGFDYFVSVGRERRNKGYTSITMEVMKELNLPYPKEEIYNATQLEKDIFYRVKDKVIDLIGESNKQYHFDENQEDWVDDRYEYLVDLAGHGQEEPQEDKVDEKELLKQAKKEAKKNKKGESVINSLAGLAALKDKFGKDFD